jgi:formylmethanofuran dehydrogenase subunit E
MAEKKPQSESNPFSQHHMAPEEVIQRMFNGAPESRAVYCSRCNEQIIGLALVGEEGELRCPKCGTIAIYGNHS